MRLLLLIAMVCSAFAALASEDDFLRRACLDTRAECEETCTLSFGTSLQTRDKLGPCRAQCEAAEDRCLSPTAQTSAAPPDAGPPAPLPRAVATDGGTQVLAIPVQSPRDEHRVKRLTPSPKER